METVLQVKKHVPSGTIVLDRPQCRNALSRWTMVQLAQALDDLHKERQVRAVILTGSGTAFCSGVDLNEIHQSSKEDDALMQWHRDAVQFKELLEKMMLFPKPIIAAVNGPAVAAGASLLLASDIVIATPEAKFLQYKHNVERVAWWPGLQPRCFHFASGRGRPPICC